MEYVSTKIPDIILHFYVNFFFKNMQHSLYKMKPPLLEQTVEKNPDL